MKYHLIKRQGRLQIEDEDGKLFYCPPDWLKPFIRDRKGMTQLAEDLSTYEGNPIKLIIAFETGLRP